MVLMRRHRQRLDKLSVKKKKEDEMQFIATYVIIKLT